MYANIGVTQHYNGDGDLVQREGPEGTTLYVAPHFELFVPADPPAPPTPTPPPTPNPNLTHRTYLALAMGGCGYIIDGVRAEHTKYQCRVTSVLADKAQAL